MMNLLAVGFLITTLAAAGVWSPPPPTAQHHHPDSVLREGHRVIVVEYERDLPSVHHKDHPANLVPEIGHDTATDVPPASHDGVKDKICDAFGNCKDKISNLLGKGKDKASEVSNAAEDVVKTGKEKAAGIASELSNAVGEAVDKGKTKLSEKAAQIGDGAKKVSDAVGEGKAKVSEKADQLKEGAKDVGENLTAAMATTVDKAEEAAAEIRKNLTDILHRARDVAYDAAAYADVPKAVRIAAAVGHLLSAATAYGAAVWVTFVSSHVLAQALPRQQFGVVQSRLYPVYFRAVAYATGVALLGHYLRRAASTSAGRVQGYNLAAVLGLALLNMWYFEPKATKVMFERMKMEKEEGRGQDVADVVLETSATTSMPAEQTVFRTARTATVMMDQEAVKSRMVKLSNRLKRLNTYSSVLNMLALMGLTWHLVHLSRCMQVSC